MGQSEQVSSEVAATELLYWPGRQKIQVEDAEEGEYWPLRQSEHVSSEVADVEALYLPAPQSVQLEDAGEEEYWPWRQPTHADEDVSPSCGLLVPAGQSEQASSEVADIELLYLPEIQELQDTAPGSENVPAVQVSHEVVPELSENVPASHSEQVVDELAPVVDENFPAVHSVQS